MSPALLSGRGARDADSNPDDEIPPKLEAFARVGLVSRLDSRTGRVATLGLGVLVAVVAVNTGVGAAVSLLAALSVLIVVLLVALERDRWAAQLVMVRFRAQRQIEWIRDTDGPPPDGSRAEAEVWLGVHQPGTVPQRYRAIVANQTGDPVVAARESAALPNDTPTDRASRDQLALGSRWVHGDVDTTPIRSQIGDLPDTIDGRMLKTWAGQVEATERLLHGDRDWVRSLLAVRDVVPHPTLPRRWWIGIWASRLLPVISLLISSVLFSAIGMSMAPRGAPIPPDYANTELAVRGDIPAFDVDRVWATLPELERALPAAIVIRRALPDEERDELLVDGMPTVIWAVGRIDIAPPSLLAGHRIWEIEVLLGDRSDHLAILTMDRAEGVRHLVRLDGSVVAALRVAAGLDDTGPSD